MVTLENMLQGLKRTTKLNNVIFDSARIAGVDYDKEIFEDEKYGEEEDTDDKYNEADDYKYDELGENKLAKILQEPNHFQVPHETE